LVQDTFLKAHLHFDRFQGTAGPELRAWLRELLLNNLRDFRRLYVETVKRQVGREGASTADSELPDADLPSPSGLAMRDEEALRLESVLKRLSEEHRQVLELRYRQELPFDEIARQMNRTPNAVRKLWSRAILRLQQEWTVGAMNTKNRK
jgi:RNA polymerase sigma-70 factor (ECF subfamily)